jgi:hypothetical protein
MMEREGGGREEERTRESERQRQRQRQRQRDRDRDREREREREREMVEEGDIESKSGKETVGEKGSLRIHMRVCVPIVPLKNLTNGMPACPDCWVSRASQSTHHKALIRHTHTQEFHWLDLKDLLMKPYGEFSF